MTERINVLETTACICLGNKRVLINQVYFNQENSALASDFRCINIHTSWLSKREFIQGYYIVQRLSRSPVDLAWIVQGQ